MTKTMENSMDVPQNTRVAYDPAIPLLSTYLGKTKI